MFWDYNVIIFAGFLVLLGKKYLESYFKYEKQKKIFQLIYFFKVHIFLFLWMHVRKFTIFYFNSILLAVKSRTDVIKLKFLI